MRVRVATCCRSLTPAVLSGVPAVFPPGKRTVCLPDTRAGGMVSRSRHRGRGFTLIEIMMAIAIAALVLGIGIPQLIRFNRNNTLSSSVTQMKAALLEAASQARTKDSQPVVTGYNPLAPATLTWSGKVDELRVTLGDPSNPNGSPPAKLSDTSFGEFSANLKLVGPSLPSVLSQNAVVASLWYHGVFQYNVDVWDSSGSAVWDSTFDATNGSATWELHLAANSGLITLVEK